MRRLSLSLILLLFCGAVAAEQAAPSKTAATTVPPKPVTKSAPNTSKKSAPKSPIARDLFGAATAPAPLAARAIGSYAKGCLAGGVSLPINGPDWQVMRLSRNRNWGTPELLDFLEKFASDARGLDGWPGLLIGDMSQPRGGPMLNGHSSHQVGLDVDIWFTPMPEHELSSEEREFNMALNMVAKNSLAVDPHVWTHERTALVREAAQNPVVARIFVNPAIKKAMCREAGDDRSWLSKVRPWWRHDEHFHVRLACPSDSPQCKPQPAARSGDGCGHELDSWLKKPSCIFQRPVRSQDTTSP